MEAIPHAERTTHVAALNLKSTMHGRLKEKEYHRHTSDLKTTFDEENMKTRVLYSILHLEPSSCHISLVSRLGV